MLKPVVDFPLENLILAESTLFRTSQLTRSDRTLGVSFRNPAEKETTMKKQIYISLGIILFVFSSCDEKLKVKVTENKDIKIERYTISTITSGHRFCDITNKRWNKTERIYEADWGAGTDSLYIKNDSIIIKADIENSAIYDLAAIKFGYKIVLIDIEK